MNKIEIDIKGLRIGLIIEAAISAYILIDLVQRSSFSESQSQFPEGAIIIPLALFSLLYSGVQLLRTVFASNLRTNERLLYSFLLILFVLPSMYWWFTSN